MEIFQLFKSLLSRAIFFVHGLVSVYLVVKNREETVYWACSITIFMIIIETFYTIVIRKGKEYDYFWPSGFLYILTMIPIIWVIELELLKERLNENGDEQNKQTTNTQGNNTVLNTRSNGIQLSNEVIGKKVCELGIIIGLISGRWLMPRGSMTRDQLSALLLGYVGNAADILELFETFEEPDISRERSVTIGVIAVYTWSIFQFTLFTTATIKDKKDIQEDIEKVIAPQKKKNQVAPARKISGVELHKDHIVKKKYIEDVRTRKYSVENNQNRGRGRKVSTNNQQYARKAINAEASAQINEEIRRRAIHGEVFQILVTLFMQDGPFLILRLYLIVKYNVVSEMHIFFTCKNAIVSILLVYRLCILTCRGEDKETDLHREEAAAKLHNVQVAIMATHLEEEKMHRIRVQ